MKNFDLFVGIDWSGAKSPINTRSISLATVGKARPLMLEPDIRSRQAVCDYIKTLFQKNKRVLIGIDCNFGYADSIIQKQLGQGAKAYDLWAEIDSISKTEPNFFAGPFWQHQKYKKFFWTEGKKPTNFSVPKRQTEKICAANDYGVPESPFKLIGAKQVGKGGMAGMRMAYFLKQEYGDELAVWPFDNPDKAQIVITEIYPRQFIRRAGFGPQKIRDQQDLDSILQFYGCKTQNYDAFTDHDTDALASAAGLRYLCGQKKNIPNAVAYPQSMNDAAKRSEGWIFGVGDKE